MGSNLHFKQITGVPAWRMDCDREGDPLGSYYRLAEANGGEGEGMCDQRAWSPGMRASGEGTKGAWHHTSLWAPSNPGVTVPTTTTWEAEGCCEREGFRCRPATHGQGRELLGGEAQLASQAAMHPAPYTHTPTSRTPRPQEQERRG